MLKAIGVLEKLINQKGLSYPSSTVDCDQLRPVFVHGFLKKLEFSFPSNHNFPYLAVKVLKRFVLAKHNVAIWP